MAEIEDYAEDYPEDYPEDYTLICPITTEPIKHAVCTIIGSIYERDAITEWLKMSYRDPLTNIRMASNDITFIMDLPEDPAIAEATVEETTKICKLRAKVIAAKYRRVLSNPDNIINYEETIILYKILEGIRTRIQMVNKRKWQSYNMMKKYNYQYNYKPSPDYIDIFDRPSNTGFGYQFVTLDHLTIRNRNHKSDRYDFADLSRCMFISCGFDRCTFIGTNLENVVFVNCSFNGDEVSFYKSTGNPIFVGCVIEPVGSWTSVSSEDSKEIFVKCLQSRGLEVGVENIGDMSCYKPE
jgi:hypothetical protein